MDKKNGPGGRIPVPMGSRPHTGRDPGKAACRHFTTAYAVECCRDEKEQPSNSPESTIHNQKFRVAILGGYLYLYIYMYIYIYLYIHILDANLMLKNVWFFRPRRRSGVGNITTFISGSCHAKNHTPNKYGL